MSTMWAIPPMCKSWRSFDDHGGELLQMMRMLMRDAKRFVQLEICLVRCKTRSDSQKKDKTHFPATKRPPSYSKSRQWVWLSCKKWVVGMVELQKSRQWVWLSCNCGYGIVGMIELQCKKVRKGIDQVYKRPPTIKLWLLWRIDTALVFYTIWARVTCSSCDINLKLKMILFMWHAEHLQRSDGK